jgi:hypothetical protein
VLALMFEWLQCALCMEGSISPSAIAFMGGPSGSLIWEWMARRMWISCARSKEDVKRKAVSDGTFCRDHVLVDRGCAWFSGRGFVGKAGLRGCPLMGMRAPKTETCCLSGYHGTRQLELKPVLCCVVKAIGRPFKKRSFREWPSDQSPVPAACFHVAHSHLAGWRSRER